MSDFITNAELRIESERLCDENERLEAENAELRNDADLLRAMLSQERLEKQCYMAENAKLRKLLLDVWNDAMQFDGFWDYVNDDGEIYNEDELPHYYDRMRELGVEVEG